MTQGTKIKRIVKIALGQMKPTHGDMEANLAVMERMTVEAALKGADIICFPELSSNGYFVSRDGLEALAEPSDGGLVKRIAGWAEAQGIYIIAGYAEREGNRIFNTCLLAGRDGAVVGNARKVHLWKSEKKRFDKGDCFPVFDTELAKIAILNCYDLEFPEPSRIAALKGAEIIFCPAAWSRPSRDRWDLDIRANSMFNQLFVAGANYADELCCGSSTVAGPDGGVLALASADGEEILFTELDRGEIERVRKEVPYFTDMDKTVFLRELGSI